MRQKGIRYCQAKASDPNGPVAGLDIMAVTYRSPDDPKDDYDKTMLRPRDVITICDIILTKDMFLTIGGIAAKSKLAGLEVDLFQSVVSFKMLHEVNSPFNLSRR